MSNVVVTELVVDARGAEAGSARYERAMRAAQSAIDRMIDREERLQVATEKASAAMTGGAASVGRVASQWQNLAARADPAIRASQMIADAQLKADAAIRRGITTEAEATRVLAAYSAQLNGTANATRELQRQQEALARQDLGNIALVDQHLAKAAQEAGTLTRAYNPLIVAQEKYNASVDQANRLARQNLISEETRRAAIAASRQALQAAGAPTGQFSSSLQRGLDQAAVVRHSGGLARASASVFEEDAKAMEKMTAAAAKLRGEIDPLAAAQARLATELAEYQALAARGLISNDELVKATTLANDGYAVMAARLGAVGTQAKLTQNQMLNLSRQANDSITMAAMGMPISMIVTSQLGQIYGALEENSRGVRGSIEAITNSVKGFFAGLGPVSIALGALGVAAAAFAFVTRRDVQPLEDVIAGQADAVRQLRDAYGLAGDAAEDYARRAPKAVRLGVADTNAESIERARQELQDRYVDQFVGMQNNRYRQQPQFAGLREAFDELARSVEAGRPRFREFEEDLANLPLEEMDGHTREVVKANREWAEGLVPLQARIAETVNLMDESWVQSQRMAASLKGLREEMDQMGGAPQQSSAEAIRSNYNQQLSRIQAMIATNRVSFTAAQGMLDDLTEQANRALSELGRPAQESLAQAQDAVNNFDLSPLNRQIAETTQDYDRRIAEYARTTNDVVGLTALQAEKEAALGLIRREGAREEDARRANYELDLRAINARTAAEKASLESERVRIDLMAQGYSATEAAARATEAYTLAIAQSSAEWMKADESRQFAREDALANAQAQVDSFGMSAGAAQAYGQAIQQLTAYRRAAAEAGMPIDPAEEQAIRDAASAAGAYTDALARMNMERDQTAQLELLRGEARLVGLSENARSIAMAGLQAEADLRRQNLSTTDDQGQAYIRNAQAAAGMRVEIDRQTKAYETQQQFVENVLSTSLDALFNVGKAESWGDAVLGIFADIGRQFQELAKQNLMQALFGQNYTTGQLAPGQRSIAQPGFPVAANQNAPQSYAAPVLAVERRALPDLTRATSNLAAAAKAIRTIESGSAAGDYAVRGPTVTSGMYKGERALGAYQIMPGNLPQWSQAAVGRVVSNVEFLSNPRLQDAIFEHRFGGYMDKYGAEGASRAWFAGEGGMRNYRAQDVVGTSVGGYGSRFGQLYEQHGGGAGASQAITQAVETGTKNALQQVPAPSGVDPWSGLRTVTPGANNVNTGWFGEGGRLQGFMQSPFGQGAMNAVGAFGSGYSSGSVGGGALSGALPMLMMGNPVGAVVGALAGAAGGLFGGRAKRRQEHQQRAEAWNQMAPQWSAFQDEVRTGTGPTSGLRASQGAMVDQFGQFVQAGSAAWKNGTNNSSALYSQVGAELGEYFARTNAEFGRAYEAQVASLNAGQGLSGPFISARDEILEAGKTLATFVDDTRVVFGDGSVEAQRAAEASIAQLRALMSGADELSEIGAAVQAMEGAAAGLHTQLEALGVSAADAGAAVSQDLAAAMGRLRGDFAQGIQDQLWSLDGRGYIAEFRQFFTDIDGAIQDALLVGADRGLVDELFVKQAQSMVDGAQLSGDAFAELITAMPRLSGVVREFSAAAEEAAKRTTDQIDALRLSYGDRVFEASNDNSTEAGSLARFDRYAAREREEEIKAGGDAILDLERALAAERGQIVKQFADRAIEEQKRALESAQSFLDGFTRDIGSYLDGLRAGPDSPLTGQARVNEAQAQFDKQYALAMTGDRDALSSITGYADRLIEADRAYNTSSPAAQATFDRVTSALEGLPKQLKAEDIIAAEIAKAAALTVEAIQSASIALAGRISTDFDRLDTSLDGLLSYDELRAGLDVTDAQLKRIFAEIDLNGDLHISRLESLLASDGLTRSTLQSAFVAGPTQTAGALAPHFARLDTSVNGLLDFNEMRAALGGIATDAQIRQMMTVLDANGDGQISHLELLNARSNTQIGSLNDLQALTRLTWDASRVSQTYQERTRHFTEVNSQLLQSIATTLANSLSIQERMRANLAEANGRVGARQFMTGGYTGDMASTAVAGVVHGREFVAHEEATRRWRPMLEQMNAGTFQPPVIPMSVMPRVGNDNQALQAEVKGLRADLARVEKALVAATLASGENVREGVDDVASKMRAANKVADRVARR